MCVCLDVFVLAAQEAEGGGVVWTSALGACVSECAQSVKWRRERIEALVCIME